VIFRAQWAQCGCGEPGLCAGCGSRSAASSMLKLTLARKAAASIFLDAVVADAVPL
jgi:hypothetical protein